jgi:hypothetical protein
MVPAVRPLGSLSMARGCARIDSRPDIAKIGSADRVEVHHARLLAVIGVRKTFPHGLGQKAKSSMRSAVGTVIADRPPPKSVQAEFPHTAPTLGA